MAQTDKQTTRKVDNCRLCHGELGAVALSLGSQPISNRLPREAQLAQRYPLEIALCTDCGLVQLAHHLDAKEHFHDDYAYLSGASKTWLAHCADYAQDVTTKYGVAAGELVIEAGSNDGTLLNALQEKDHRVLGVEPSGNVAEIANNNGAPTINAFFNRETAAQIKSEHGPAKLIIGNNVLAHVPDTDGFLQAARDLISDDGMLCFEFPYFVNIVDKMYFDTIYHEHYTYLGVGCLNHWAARNDMTIVGIDEQTTHGGTLRVLMKRGNNHDVPPQVTRMIKSESKYLRDQTWFNLSAAIQDWRDEFRALIAKKRAEGGRIVGYAAASKATVLLNYLDLSVEDIEYCCDASALKQDRFIPGANIPVVSPDMLKRDPPDTIIVFAWNIFAELRGIIAGYIEAPVELINPLPDIKVLSVDPEKKQ